MATLAHHKYPLSSQCLRPRHLPRVSCSATTTTTTTTTTASKQKSNPNCLAITINSSVVVAPVPRPTPENDKTLRSTWAHRAWVAGGCTTVLASLARSMVPAVIGSHEWVGPAFAGMAGYILADLGSGVYHWGIDNYGGASTPIFGAQIEAFQGHHKWPWTITRRQFANNMHALARMVTFVVLPIDLLCDDPVIHGFVGVCSGCIMFSQQFHAWAHGTRSKLPDPVVALQEAGVLVSRVQHGAHHRPPYNNNYCIVSGVWNEWLDENKVFEALEMALFFKLGLRPRSWSEPGHEWVEEIDGESLPKSSLR